MNDKIVLIVGPSGSGKSTVADYMEKLYKLKNVVSYTTRPPRYDGEKGHVFLSEEVFKSLPDMCAYTFFNGYHYGVTADVVNRSDLYIIDPAGVKYFKEHYSGFKKPVVVYIDVPEEVCRQRMLARGDSEEATIKRLENDKAAFAKAKEMADVVVVNGANTAISDIACEILNKSGLCEIVSEKDQGRQNLTQTELRIEGVIKNIEKAQNTLARHHKTLEKKRSACLVLGFDPENANAADFANNKDMKSYWAICEYEDVKDKISDNVKKINGFLDKLNEYRAKKDVEDKKNDVPYVPAVEEFLENWRAEAEVWLREQVVALKNMVDEIAETRKSIRKKYLPNEYKFRKEIEAEEKEAGVDYKSANRRLAQNFTSDVHDMYNHRGLEFEARLQKNLASEVRRKRIDLFKRCSAEVGVITDASRLYVGDDLNLNGVVIGEKGKASVRTIGAGGYNIQCFHYRVLVNRIREKESLDNVISSSEKLAASQERKEKTKENSYSL